MEKPKIHFGVYASTKPKQEIYLFLFTDQMVLNLSLMMKNNKEKTKNNSYYFEGTIESSVIPLESFYYCYGMTTPTDIALEDYQKVNYYTILKGAYQENIIGYRFGKRSCIDVEDEFGLVETQIIMTLEVPQFTGKVIGACVRKSKTTKINSLSLQSFYNGKYYKEWPSRHTYKACVKLLDCLDQKETPWIFCEDITDIYTAFCIIAQLVCMLQGDEKEFEKAFQFIELSAESLYKNELHDEIIKVVHENVEFITKNANQWILMTEEAKLAYI